MRVLDSNKCLCRHTRKNHDELSPSFWIRYDRALIGYKDTPTTRERFWARQLTGISDSDWRCSECNCQEFRLDNLDFVEKEAKRRNLI
jgi:hypothetical protein